MYIILQSIGKLLNIIEILILIRVFLNIFNISGENKFMRILYDLTEPIIYPARYLLNILGLNRGMLDFSPWIAILIIRLFYQLLVGVLL
ncbi:YggT family protein [Soehngenia longivitae]|jgi:YggT family protein|uniref:YggT family protein n=1 Tax=Soehngenia longivitae TaxID=2562294 RepID=A0A4Z0D2K0_9FIRM|nr:YggT family protein [Soehngenia longivitae]TFZ39558.1 YggT family protein [Soehngenia longivitae]